MILLTLILACETSRVEVKQTGHDSRARAAHETEAVPPLPDCGLASMCSVGLEPAKCVDAPALFIVDMFGDTVMDVGLDETHLHGLALEPGEWHTLFPDPLGGCELVVFDFVVESEVSP